MEHLMHLFGGGCGEHMLLPGLAALATSAGMVITMARGWIANALRRLKGSSNPPG